MSANAAIVLSGTSREHVTCIIDKDNQGNLQ